MEVEKRRTIVKEIEHWRKSKLLPEKYCNFLLNLYLDKTAMKPSKRKWMDINSIKDSHWKFWVMYFGFFLLIAFIIINFNAFSLPMQILVSVPFIFGCIYFGYLKKQKDIMISYCLFGLSFILMLFLGMYLVEIHAIKRTFWGLIHLSFCSILWIVIGVTAKKSVFHFCGWIGLLLVYGWMLSNSKLELTWLFVQLFWLPASIFFGWIAWLVHTIDKMICRIFMILSLLLWFVPEIFYILMHQASVLIQVSLVCKAAISGIVLYCFRNKWVEWV